MNEYKLSHVERFERISIGFKDSELLRGLARGYLYNDSDDKGVYVYMFLSVDAIDELYEELQSKDGLRSDEAADEIVRKHTCPYFFPWSEVAYLQLD
jgi:hypothetical protein